MSEETQAVFDNLVETGVIKKVGNPRPIVTDNRLSFGVIMFGDPEEEGLMDKYLIAIVNPTQEA